jgi:hypothetical protein
VVSDTNEGVGGSLEHFQAAARELIAAFRSVLDVAEELVEDPDSVKDAFGAFGNLARQAARQAAGFAAGAGGSGGSGGSWTSDGNDAKDPVEHIDLD